MSLSLIIESNRLSESTRVSSSLAKDVGPVLLDLGTGSVGEASDWGGDRTLLPGVRDGYSAWSGTKPGVV